MGAYCNVVVEDEMPASQRQVEEMFIRYICHECTRKEEQAVEALIGANAESRDYIDKLRGIIKLIHNSNNEPDVELSWDDMKDQFNQVMSKLTKAFPERRSRTRTR